MLVHSPARGSRVHHRRAAAVAAALMLAMAALAASLLASGTATASNDAPAANAAAAKKCGAGKQLVKRPGRSAVCAKKCPSGKKRKVSSTGKVSCVKKTSGTTGSGPTDGTTGSGPTPPPGGTTTDPGTPPPGGSGGPAAGSYSGQTEQQRPVTFVVEGNEVKNFEAGVNLWCSTMGNSRMMFDAIANVPPMAIGPDGTFSYEGPPDTGNMKINGRITGSSATGTVGMMRGDTNYQNGQMTYGSCSAMDVPWSATAG